MTQHLTIAYITCRKEPQFGWFFDSLRRQTLVDDILIIIVDFHFPNRNLKEWAWLHPPYPRASLRAPKPTVWQGPHRLTKEDWFAKSNACNTALCLAPDGYIAYVDDLCVLAPTWMQAVRDAMAGNYIVFGSYKKCRNMVVKDGVLESYEVKGNDSRLPFANGEVTECPGDLLYGCSFATPVEALLEVNGWDENCDGLGSEDSILGVRLANTGHWKFKFDKRMTTYESEEGHEPKGSIMRRSDYGKSPNDKSHAILNCARATTYAPNYFEGGIRKLREHVLAGGSFPIMKVPEHEWFTGTALKDL